jgi:hypothetical protein
LSLYPHRRQRFDPLGLRTKPAHQKDDKANQQNEANPTSAKDGASKVKTAAAK